MQFNLFGIEILIPTDSETVSQWFVLFGVLIFYYVVIKFVNKRIAHTKFMNGDISAIKRGKKSSKLYYVPCDTCENSISLADKVCNSCGHVYVGNKNNNAAKNNNSNKDLINPAMSRF